MTNGGLSKREVRFRDVIDGLNGLDRAVAVDAYRQLVLAHVVGSAGRNALPDLDHEYPGTGVFTAVVNGNGKYAHALDSASDMLEAEIALNQTLARDVRESLQHVLNTLVSAGVLDMPTGSAIARASALKPSLSSSSGDGDSTSTDAAGQQDGSATSRPLTESGAGKSAAVRLVPAEQNVMRRFAVSLPEEREAHRREGELVDRYRAYLAERGFGSSRVEMVFESVRLFNDLYVEPPRNQLVEAKGDARRESIRMGIGQLLDYLHNIDLGRSFPDRPAPALLLPRYPGTSIEGLLDSQSIALVWEREDGGYEDNRRGRFT